MKNLLLLFFVSIVFGSDAKNQDSKIEEKPELKAEKSKEDLKPQQVKDSKVEEKSGTKAEKPKEEIRNPVQQVKMDIVVDENESYIFESHEPIEEVFVVNPKTADIRMIDKRSFYIFGLIPGDTRIDMRTSGKTRTYELNVTVRYPVKKLKKAIDDVVPDNSVVVKSIKKGILLEGSVETSSEADTLQKIAAQFVSEGAELINNVKIVNSMQVSLQIKVASVSRKQLNALNLDWSGNINTSIGKKNVNFQIAKDGSLASKTLASGSKNALDITTNWYPLKDITAALDFLEKESLATILAEPMLTTLSGVAATFDVGGTRPILKTDTANTSGGSNVAQTVEFKPYGMKLTFTPTIIGENILLAMKVDLTDIDDSRAVTDNFGNVISGETTKSTNTSVILGDGQSLMIAGVIEKRKLMTQENNNPFLSNIPILNAIFQKDTDNVEEQEVVIVVKPQLVTPMQANRKVKVPTEVINFAPMVDAFLYGGLTRKKTSSLPKTFRAGFFLG